MWPKSHMEPLLPVLPGRPKLHNRNKDKDEAAKKKVTQNAGKDKLTKVGVIIHFSICGKNNHNKKCCPTIKPPVQEGLGIPAPIGRRRGRKKKPSNMTDGESSGAAATNEMGRKRKQTNDHMDEGLHIDTQTSIVQGNNDVASPSRVTRSKTNAVPSLARVTRSKRNTMPSLARLNRSKAVPLTPRVPSTSRRFVSQPNVPSTSRRVVNQPKAQSQPNVQSKTLGVRRILRVQKEISKCTTFENEGPLKSTTVEKAGPNMSKRAESVVPNVQSKSKTLGVKRNLQEFSNTEVSSNPEIRAKDRAPNTQKVLTKPAWVPQLKSLLGGVRFSNTKRGQLSAKSVAKKQKKAKEASDQHADAKLKKFSHSSRRRRVDKVLLETPEDEIDYQKVPLRDLILLAEHKERQTKKQEAIVLSSALLC
ncbi:hypothetical protein BUALT_Bualt12G0140700 [Buddleja alternifolia]|uniref:Uncharacterized protein n=1 Tax=Buddleja alternifolia TaxID=168488 RepID=A0AAV6WY16_9LAMI|nr:hypothetical protein BUALT_Bualt12G0140700 [Buddleja alternifolia]